MSYKICLGIILWASFAINLTAQDRTLHISDGHNPIDAVHVVLNGTPVTVTDSSGTAILKSNACNGTVKVSHILFQDQQFAIPQRDTSIILVPKQYLIDSLSFQNKDDKRLLKQYLHHGLQVRHSPTPVSFCSLDSLSSGDKVVCFKARGTASFLYRYKNPIVNIADFSMSIDCEKKQQKHYSKQIKEDISKHSGCAIAYALLFCFEWEDDNLFLNYLGEDEEKYIFKFYITPQFREGEFKSKGLVFLDKKEGVIIRITAILSPWKANIGVPYNLDAVFKYSKDENTISPSHIQYVSFYSNDDRTIIRTKKSIIDFDGSEDTGYLTE